MKDETWRSVDTIHNQQGEPHVLQQKVEVYAEGVSEEGGGYTKPVVEHRLVPLTELT